MNKIKDLVVTIKGKDDKKYYKNIGSIWQREDGSLSYLIDALGTAVWANGYDPKPKEEKPVEKKEKPEEKIVDLDDEIPF
jgi:hypothetical protein